MSATAQPTSPHVMNTYGRLPIALSHGQGCRVWDTTGKAYLDGLGGIAVNTLGHNHPELVPALQDQISKLIHSSNYYHVPGQEQLAAKLTELSGLTNAFFCCTGLEANEIVGRGDVDGIRFWQDGRTFEVILFFVEDCAELGLIGNDAGTGEELYAVADFVGSKNLCAADRG